MEKQNVKFIRKGGRIIPIREKGGASKPSKSTNKIKKPEMLRLNIKAKDRRVGERAKEGLEFGAKLGAIVGAGIGLANSDFALPARHSLLKFGATVAASTIGWGAFGAGFESAFGRRKTYQVSLKKPKK
jgi:hypothetical protein